jgi:hypothetical protein
LPAVKIESPENKVKFFIELKTLSKFNQNFFK